MKVSLKWLQTYFDNPLPGAEAIADALTFHAFEIEEARGDALDVKVLPNRAADCLCHRGIAKELSAILDIPLKVDPLREALPDLPKTNELEVVIEDPKKCLRYTGALVRGVKVGPSPTWLKEALEAVGQRSINNVVDATNYVMLDIGQPLHAFDAGKLAQKDGKYEIGIKKVKSSGWILTLEGVKRLLPDGILTICDNVAEITLAIAGIKGGRMAEVTAETTDLIVESANFDAVTVRRSAQRLKLFTDASVRFQNRPSPELVAYGMRDVLALITKIAGGEVVGVVDEYPSHPEQGREVSVSLAKINGVLGSHFSHGEVEDVFKRLTLSYKIAGDTFTVTPPFERTDLTIPEDLVEEIGRIIGYDRVPATELPPLSGEPDQARYRGIEKLKDELITEGYTEVSTQSFAKEGDIYLANPFDKELPALRRNLSEGTYKAEIMAMYNAPLILPPNASVKIFEIGTVFSNEGEHIEMLKREGGHGNAEIIDDTEEDASYIPKRYELGAYKPFSAYPFITRDVACWVPSGTESVEVEKLIRTNAGELLVRSDQFDRFEKEGKVSLAFRLVFQSMERTLTDKEVNSIMAKISGDMTALGYEVR